jgi:hypothetical protein
MGQAVETRLLVAQMSSASALYLKLRVTMRKIIALLLSYVLLIVLRT